MNKIDNNLKSNENTDSSSIESEIIKSEKRLRKLPKKGWGVFTSQKSLQNCKLFWHKYLPIIRQSLRHVVQKN